MTHTPDSTLSLAVNDALSDAVTDLNSIAVSLDFVAHGVKSFHQGAYWLLIELCDRITALEERLQPLCRKEVAQP